MDNLKATILYLISVVRTEQFRNQRKRSLLKLMSLFSSEHYHEDLLAAAILCPALEEEEEVMPQVLIHFWNSVFSLMIITAILGNLAVLYIVISI